MKKTISLLLALAMICSVVFALSVSAADDKSSWQVTASSEMHWGLIKNAFDGDTETFWHSKYTADGGQITSQDNPPFEITVVFPQEKNISGVIYTPRQGSETGRWINAEIYVSESAGSKGTKVKDASFDYKNEKTQTVAFGKTVRAKRVTIVITLSTSGFGSCAELDFVADGKASGSASDLALSATSTVDKSSWQITASSEMHWGLIKNAFDGDTKTFWHSKYVEDGGQITSQDNPPFEITVVFPQEKNISGVIYTPRQGSETGRWINAEIYVSESAGSKGTKVKDASFDYKNEKTQTVAFGKTLKAKRVTIVITLSTSGFGSCAELDFVTDGEANNVELLSSEPGKVSVEGAEISANSEMHWGLIKNAFDGDVTTFWHSKYVVENDNITSQDKPPFEITVKFPNAVTISGMYYTPRQGNETGRWADAEVYASESGTDKGTKVASIKYTGKETEKMNIPFDKTVTVKKVTIIINYGVNEFASAAELEFYNASASSSDENKDDTNAFDPKDWKIEVNSTWSWNPITYAFDGNQDTFWHSNYTVANGQISGQDVPPYYINITFPKEEVITGFSLTPRTGNPAGRVKAFKFYASDKDSGEMSLVYEGTFLGLMGTDSVDFNCGIKAKRIMLEIIESMQGFGVIAEMNLFQGDENTEVVSYDNIVENVKDHMLFKIDSSGFTAKNDLDVWINSVVENVFDGTGATWQTVETSDAVVLKTDLGQSYTFSAISIIPRQTSDYHGYWENFDIWISEDGVNYTPLKENYSFGERSLYEKYIYFDKPVKARYIDFEVTKYTGGRVSCAEIGFWQTRAQREADDPSIGKFIMKIGSPNIEITKQKKTYTKTLDVAPYITSMGSTLIPLRGLLEEMGAEVSWDDKTQEITVSKGKLKITLQIRNKLVRVNSPLHGNITYTLYSAPRIQDSRTFVPVRFLSEQLGYNVSWDGETQTITIEKS